MMKSKIRLISCLLVGAVCAGAAAMSCSCGSSAVYTRCDANGEENPSGGYIKFGSYPQTEVTDGAIVESLSNEAGTLPANGNSQSWSSYKYYAASDNSTDFMWYKDVSCDGEKYRGVYFTSYRPYRCYCNSKSDESVQDDNGYKTGSVYWFKYEPILWRILSEENGAALVLSETILDSQQYYWDDSRESSRSAVENYDDSYYAGKGSTSTSSVYDNNYKYSDIRAWLNENFYNSAFTSSEKKIIKTTAVDNSADSTTDEGGNIFKETEYFCEDTEDKVFLLSVSEALNSSYGFSAFNVQDAARKKKASDYAKSQGLDFITFAVDSGNGCGWWWLRSPGGGYPFYAHYVGNYGSAENMFYNSVQNTGIGVLPALTISLK